ncbi:MAG: pantoate--beta-alanine ligase [Marinicaulis sp.]|nr:pantoate--beta-alanine ligase [Marinicaulis sp.]
MIIVKTKSEAQEVLARWRKAGQRIGVVPTMGALHRGHLSLIDTAKSRSDRIVVSIFVNPLQFGLNEDFDSYPRQMEGDLELLKSQGCDIVFAPDHAELFPADFSTNISVAGVGEGHCSATRPQFFDGVATIVTKLLMILSPDLIVFGEKDYQQLAVIKRLTRDLDINAEVIGSPTIRETDGLAMSSRNQYLSSSERAIAPVLFETLALAAKKLAERPDDCRGVSEWAAACLLEAGFSKIDYFNIVDAASLATLEYLDRPGRLLAAAWIGKTRLIDNTPISFPVDE